MTAPALRGHAALMERLEAAMARDRLPHALLFSGPAGIGKFLAARRLAARIACSERSRRGAGADPCGECAPCRQISAGTHPDVQVVRLIAGKKEIGIDLIRRVKRFVQMSAVSAPRKIAIIDDAERLSVAAQNALLKTLEEPAGQALLILVSASAGSLLPTVRSRCQRLVFRPLGDGDVREVLAEQGVDAEEAGFLAPHAEGSPGRALEMRKIWSSEEHRLLRAALAELDAARYGPVLAMSKLLGRSEQDMISRLEDLLARYREEAVQVLGAAHGRDARPEVASIVRRADLITEALRVLRHRNPNRPLLAEALLLRLARS
jgi:DNA polymerase-3 subunit delta'